MANSTIDSVEILLYDNWPGDPIPMPASFPQDGFSSDAAGFNSTSALWAAGTKIQVMCDGTVGQPGPATFIYLQVSAQNTNTASIDAKQLCVPVNNSEWWKVSNDPDVVPAKVTGQVAIALDPIADTYWGWFWCGGVCPVQWVYGLSGTYATSGEIDARDTLGTGDLDDPDLIGFGQYHDDHIHAAAGYAINADD